MENVSRESRPAFAGRGDAFLWLSLENFLLSLVTLGIYSFWAKVKRLKFFFSNTSFQNHAFQFHGNGEELFFGFVKVMIIAAGGFFVIALVTMLATSVLGDWVAYPIGIAVYAAYLLLWRVAVVLSRRYRFSRTSYRSLRFSFRGPLMDFVKMSAKDSALTILTLGIYFPWQRVNEMDYFANHSYYGNRAFKFRGEGSDLLGTYLICMLLIPFTLGLSLFWLRAAFHRYQWDHLSFETLEFRSFVKGEELLGYAVLTTVLSAVTLGIMYPWCVVNQTRYLVESLEVSGLLDWSGIEQEHLAGKASGEGVADYFELDGDIGLT